MSLELTLLIAVLCFQAGSWFTIWWIAYLFKQASGLKHGSRIKATKK